MTTMRPVLLLTLLLMTACSGSQVDTSAYDHVFRLVSVNGDPIPGKILHDGVPLQMHGGRFFINDDGDCRSIGEFTPPNGRKVLRDVSASYVRDGEWLTMKWQGYGTTRGRLKGDVFIMDNHGMMFRYERE